MQIDSVGLAAFTALQRPPPAVDVQQTARVSSFPSSLSSNNSSGSPQSAATSQVSTGFSAIQAVLSPDTITALQQSAANLKEAAPTDPAQADPTETPTPAAGLAAPPPPPPPEEAATDPAEEAQATDEEEADQQQAAEDEEGVDGLTQEEQAVVQELRQRDAEVRRHEQAHAAAGGRYAGAPSYEYERGPDGQLYAVGGEVSIDTSSVRGNPEAAIAKFQQVRRAALAPSAPSPQDQRVAAEAQQQLAQARADLRTERAEERAAEAASQQERAAEQRQANPDDPVNPLPSTADVSAVLEPVDAEVITASVGLASPAPVVETASRSLQASQAFIQTQRLGDTGLQGGVYS